MAVENTLAIAQNLVPITFGQVFVKGDLAPTDTLVGKLVDGTTVPLQMDVKATHVDGSVRHAVISAVLPTLAASSTVTIGLVKSSTPSRSANTATPQLLFREGFSATASITANGTVYTASAASLLNQSTPKTWVSGPIANEWLITVPFVSAQGATHPQLSARFAVRYYPGTQNAKVDVVVENDWAYAPSPQNLTYDVNVNVGGSTVYTQSALTHYHHARWMKTFWWGKTTPTVNIRENTAYIIASKAVANYDPSITITEAELNALNAQWTGSKIATMGVGLARPYMPGIGGAPDIGLMPSWVVTHLLSMDKRARDVSIGTANQAGSWSIHYRDQTTDRPISITNHPYMTILGNPGDTFNPATGQREAFPTCTNCTSPYTADSAHAPALNYLPYILTGEYYQLEELQFWAMFDELEANPGYRSQAQGLLHQRNVRDQAWSLRNVADAAYITPDNDPLKPQLQGFAANNIAWYNTNYTNNANANTLGANVDDAIEYNGNIGIAPWMDDFFTSVIGHMREQNFAGTTPLLLYKAKFPVSRMTTPGFCWIFGGIYSLNIRATATSPLYTSLNQTYLSSLQSNYPSTAATLNTEQCASQAMATTLQLSVGEMTGYAYGPEGYPSNLQPALAHSVDSGAPGGATAWHVFMARSVKPDYSTEPQFGIVPRL